MQRSTPKVAIASRTIAALSATRQGRPGRPSPEIFTATLGQAAKARIAAPQPASPSALRSAGSPV